ncbi:MFS general substrate transporter [Daldinia vernicosa]|uniref:MFS general substrate transporter n=1 Tax=Daldinia vernicosa TaxID=114800 RepID=UPI002008A6F7|nr:MFS general substrate transporter [Daldinia vernicosa]KAI0844326.1 MFS general substrate transporter [Daldinia vernicosa]
MENLEKSVVPAANPLLTNSSPSDLEHANHNVNTPEPLVRDDGSRRKPLAFHMSFLTINIMCFLVSIDATILAVAIPVIAHELDGTTLEAFWASIAFLLAVCVIQPIHTSVSNVIGRAMPLYSSFLFFIVGSIIFAVSRSMSVLITGRVIQGFGAGGLDVLCEIILADITTLKERPKYIGYLSIPMLGGTILGPILGGIFSQFVTWRWIGWINLPLSALGLLLAVLFLSLKPINLTLQEKMRRLDWGGMALFTVGCTLFASPVAWAGAMFPWSSYKTLIPLCLGAVVLVIFAWYESRPIEPVFPYRIFKSLTASMALLTTFLHGMVTYSVVMYTPLFFQAVYMDSPLQSAVICLPLCCISAGFGLFSAIAVEIIRKYRLLIWTSWILTAVGVGIFSLLDRSSTLADKASLQVPLAIGMGSLFALLNLPLQASLPNADDMGLAAGILVSFRLFGGLIGLAICSTVFNNVFGSQISLLGPLPGDLAIFNDVREAVGLVPLLRDLNMPADLLDKVIEAYRMSISAVFWTLAGTAGVGFLLSLFIKEKSLESEELGKQQLEERR